MGVLLTTLAGLALVNYIPREEQLQQPLGQRSAVDSAQFRREIGNLLGPAVVDGNAVADFQNGAQIFPAMLGAIRSARHSVDLETYIYWSGDVAREFAQALADRARAGVKVHVLADWMGSSRMEPELIDAMRAAGVRFEYFHPLRWYDLDRINNRTHRKLLIVDGDVGFTGGVGIADSWNGHGDRPDIWRDMQFRIRGPAVAQMQAVFEDNWLTSTGHPLLGEDYYPPLPAAGTLAVQTIASSPEGGSEDMQLLYLLAIAGARSSIDLEAAYFIPDELTRKALLAALARGVRVRIVLPGPHVDSEVVRNASQAQWGDMLRAGAQLYRFQPAMLHNKLMIVDRYLTIAGSANFDNRSFSLNDESNTNVYDRAFAEHMTEVVERDIAHSQAVSLAQWRDRPWRRKFMDWLSSLVSNQL